MQENQHFIEVNQLRLGMYIHLDLGWMDHPFTLSHFKLSSEEQIDRIKKIGLKKLRYDPDRSDCAPISMTANENVSTQAPLAQIDSEKQVLDAKKMRLQQLEHAINENEKKFLVATEITKNIHRNFLSDAKTCMEQATTLVNNLVDTALMDGDIAIHALNGNRSSDTHYQHPLNVTIIGLILAKSIQLSKEETRLLGIASLLHDIGKHEISDRVLLKKEALSHSEMSHYQQHAEFGARLIKERGISARVGKILLQHHEFADGSGYPAGLKAHQTDPLAQVLVLANAYDNLCNPTNYALAKTPYEALALLFSQQRTKFNEDMLKRLIKSLGVYPPGSIVKLSNGEFASVISVNPSQPLRPYVMMYEAKTILSEPEIIDLREEVHINITHCFRPSQLPVDVLKRINPRKRMSYFIDADITPYGDSQH